MVATEISKKAILLMVVPFKCDFYMCLAARDRNPCFSMLHTAKGRCGNRNVSLLSGAVVGSRLRHEAPPPAACGSKEGAARHLFFGTTEVAP
jgi:hypothetical protein